MKHKKMLIAGLAIALLVGTVSALIPYFGKIETTATVDQAVLVDGKRYDDPILDTITAVGGESVCRHHWLTSQTSVPVQLQFDTIGVAEIPVTYCKNKLKFDIEEDEETFLLVFMDTKEGGTIYTDPEGAEKGVDYMIVDPFVNDNAFGGWYLGKWLTEEERRAAGATGDVVPGWSEPYDYAEALDRLWNAWECTGFEAEESRTDGVTHYEFTIPLECIEYDPEYGLYVLMQTGAGFGVWSDYDIKITSPFTLQPKERLDFYICYSFDLLIALGEYTITTIIEPA